MRVSTSLQECALSERLNDRRAIEDHFTRTEGTFRHSRLSRKFERHVTSPLLKHGLRIAGLYGRGVRNALAPVVRNVEMHFAGLPPQFDKFQILHISDLHIDGVDGLAEVLAELVSDLKPDVCVLTGDYRFEDRGPCEEVYRRMKPIVSSVSAKHGIFGILGNHDSSEIAVTLEEMGVRMLVNEAAEIRQRNAAVWLVGVDDPFDYQCDDLPGALASVPPDEFKILLAHAPELYNEAADRGIHLYLCGHTHAGQIRFPGVGSLRHNARCPKPLSYGPWTYQQMRGYTTAGAGSSMLPIRFNCPPEVALIELRACSPFSPFVRL